jgi:hypothetical protein
MTSLHALTTADADRWRALLPAGLSVFGSLEFARISEQHTGYAARLLAFTDEDDVVVYPLLRRPVSELPIAALRDRALWDSVSPEYTGPLAQRELADESAQRFRAAFGAYCRDERIVAEFAHLHPWRCTATAREHEVFDREIVYVDLSVPYEELWHRSFAHACRKNIVRARSEDVRVAPATTAEDIREFHRIYSQTMDRRGAMARYCFPLSYFMAFFERMPQHATFLLARHGDHVVAATLYLYDDVDVYSYLGGADHAFQHVRPTNAIVDEAIRRAQDRGQRRLILGGGYRPDDGVFRFKATFSPLQARFHVYRRVHIAEEYARLCGRWSAQYGRDADMRSYFPAYRTAPATPPHGERAVDVAG